MPALFCTALSLTPQPAAASFSRFLTAYSEAIPACDSSWALATIAWRFGYKEQRFWASSAALETFSDVRELAYRPWGAHAIPRRFCRAKVLVSDRTRPTTVYYSIGSNLGFAGAVWGVEWCVVGYDRNLAYAPNCRAARP